MQSPNIPRGVVQNAPFVTLNAKGIQQFPHQPSSARMASTRVCEPKTSGVVGEGSPVARAVLRNVARAWKPLRVLFAGILLSTGIIHSGCCKWLVQRYL